jgi:hypothetical protein
VGPQQQNQRQETQQQQHDSLAGEQHQQQEEQQQQPADMHQQQQQRILKQAEAQQQVWQQHQARDLGAIYQLDQAEVVEPGAGATAVDLLLEQVLQHMAASCACWLQQLQQQQQAGPMKKGEFAQQLARLQQTLDSLKLVLRIKESTFGVIARAADLLVALRRWWSHLLFTYEYWHPFSGSDAKALAEGLEGTVGLHLAASMTTAGLEHGAEAAAAPGAACLEAAAAVGGMPTGLADSRSVLAASEAELDVLAAHLVGVLHNLWASGQPSGEDSELCLFSMQPVLQQLFSGSIMASDGGPIGAVVCNAAGTNARVQAVQVLQGAAVHPASEVRLEAVEGAGKLLIICQEQLLQAGQDDSWGIAGRTAPKQRADTGFNSEVSTLHACQGSNVRDSEAATAAATALPHQQEQLKQLFLCLSSLLLERCSDTAKTVAEAAASALKEALIGLSTYGPPAVGHFAYQQMHHQPTPLSGKTQLSAGTCEAGPSLVATHLVPSVTGCSVAAGQGAGVLLQPELFCAQWEDNRAWVEQTGLQPLQVAMKAGDLAVMFEALFQVGCSAFLSVLICRKSTNVDIEYNFALAQLQERYSPMT